MNVDALVTAHHEQWQRLDALSRRRRLTAAEADELLELYERVSTHLSQLRSTAPDPVLVRHLSLLLTRARLSLAGRHASTWSGLLSFFTRTFPAALYGLRRWWVSTLVASVVLAALVAAWTFAHPELYTSQLSAEQIRAYVDTDFAGYYSEFAHYEFATQVWVNNAWVAAQCIAFGALGLPVLLLLWQNVVNLGVVAALMISHDRASLFFGLILPHGLLELTAVFVAGGAGLRLFWSWVEPGPLSRSASFARTGRTVVAVALGLVVVLLVSGLIEGFVTPSGLPTAARIAIGLTAWTAFLLYVFVVGRRAHRLGATGDVAAFTAGDAALVAG
ncbi:stage II sporulation protein M [Terrabacter carboxydivorans]|uniref:Stage II sporulation protein M n=1 Tax=Terrabacter carboxydivorans TaxID=619730 RepID=A0ABP5YBV7_9MICO